MPKGKDIEKYMIYDGMFLEIRTDGFANSPRIIQLLCTNFSVPPPISTRPVSFFSLLQAFF